jgi:hypothetical protein
MSGEASAFQNRLMLALSRHGFRLWRNHVGSIQDLRTERWHTFGLGKGSPDLVGFFRLFPADTACFVGIEVKMPGDRLSPEQTMWIEGLNAQGGFATVVKSPNADPSQDETDAVAEGIHNACLMRFNGQP